MKHFKVGLLSVIGLFAGVIGANAQVLCVTASGSVLALPECRPGTTQLDIAATGLQGPAGPAGPAGTAGPVGPAGPAGTANVYLTRMDYFSENRITRFNSLDLPAGTYLVAAKGSMTSTAYGGCSIVSGPEPFQTYWASVFYDNGTTQLAVVLCDKITLTDASTNVALRCGNGFGEPWNISQPVLWAMPVAP